MELLLVARRQYDLHVLQRHALQRVGDVEFQHHKLLVTNLAPQSFYHYQVTSVDASDNSVSSEDRTFVTEGDEDDDPPRFVHKPHKKQRFHDRVTIGWLMDEEARGSIEFGTT